MAPSGRFPSRPTKSTCCGGLLALLCYVGLLTHSSVVNDPRFVVVSDDFFATTHLQHYNPKATDSGFVGGLSVSAKSGTARKKYNNNKNNNENFRETNGTLFWKDANVKSPLFSLSLPNSGSLAVHRYFHCARRAATGSSEDDVGETIGRYFTNQGPETRVRDLLTIGDCIQQNVNQSRPLLTGCGAFQVWLDMDVARSKQLCYFPFMVDQNLAALVREYPRATILQVTRDPRQWYETLSYDLRQRWKIMCQNHHPETLRFPDTDSGIEEWMGFYNSHVNRVRDFVRKHAALRYIEISLDRIDEAAAALEEHLGIDPQCWRDSVNHITHSDRKSNTLLTRPNDITYPLLVTALPKSGTTTVHDYFSCGLGGGTSIHTWTKNSTTKKKMFIGECMERNLRHNKPLFHECAHYKVWSDIQYLVKPNGQPWKEGRCFVPTLPGNGGLQAFAAEYPYGTILHVVRNATQWFRSAQRWDKLADRWSTAKNCHGFPPPGSTEQNWVDFYQQHTAWVRDFASQHPTLTFVEIKLEDPNTPFLLEKFFGIPGYCWGHSNANRKIWPAPSST